MFARFVRLRAGLRVERGALNGRSRVPKSDDPMSVPAGRNEKLGHLCRARAVDRSWCRAALPGATVVVSAALLGCAWAGAGGRKASARARVEPRETRLVHEDCPVEGSGATADDINGDGRPDRRTVFGTASVRCRSLDFDFDGHVDAWVYLDPAGKVRRRENDFDRDGLADEVSLYERGVLVEQQRSTSQPGRLDTWHFFDAGSLVRTERDDNGDDYVDEWWEYPKQRSSDCPLIHSDVDGDGQPDPGVTVDVCRERDEAETAAESAPVPASISEVPTEIETPPEPERASPATGATTPAGNAPPAGNTPHHRRGGGSP